MAVQGLWSGTISFSLVAIPVRLVTAVDSGRVSFRLLHSKDNSPLARRMFCPAENRAVSSEEIVRGFEIAPDRYVLMTDEELESLTPERSRTIEILEFIDLAEVDPVFFDHPYYLVPAKGGEKAYQLLVEVLRRTNRAGLAKFVLAEREYLVAVRSAGGALELLTLHYADEIRQEDDFARKEQPAADEERRFKEIVRPMLRGFEPAKYANQRRMAIMDFLREKARTHPPVEAPAVEEEEGEGPADLVAALEESMHRLKERR